LASAGFAAFFGGSAAADPAISVAARMVSAFSITARL